MRTSRPIPIMGALLLAALSGFSQPFNYQAPITNSLPALSTNTINYTVECPETADVALQVAFKLAAPGTGDITFNVSWSLDATNWLALFALPVAATGTNTTSSGTNINVRAIPRIRLTSCSNVNTSAVQELAVWFGAKKAI